MKEGGKGFTAAAAAGGIRLKGRHFYAYARQTTTTAATATGKQQQNAQKHINYENRRTNAARVAAAAQWQR